MSGVGYTVKATDDGFAVSMRALQILLSDLSLPMQAIGQGLVTLTDLTFTHQQDPWGAKWSDLSETTLIMRAKKLNGGKKLTTQRGNTRAKALRTMLNAKILRDTGVLAASIAYSNKKDSVTVGSPEKYAATHQFGDPKNKMFGKNSAPIPARPFLPIKNNKIDLPAGPYADVLDAVNTYLGELLGKRREAEMGTSLDITNTAKIRSAAKAKVEQVKASYAAQIRSLARSTV